MHSLLFETEQEAAVAILFASVLFRGQQLTQAQIEHLSRMLVMSARFQGHSLNDLTRKALSLQAEHGSKKVIEEAAPLVDEEFKETLFAMACEIMTDNGKVDEEESEIIAMIAIYLGLSMETMKMILTTYMIRNRWNIQIIERD